MPLNGTLSEFGVAELVQMLGLARKTGVLRVRSKARGFVYFKDGGVFFAVTTTHRKPLGKRLVEFKAITKTQLEEALVIQKREAPKRRLGKILVDEGLVEKAVMEEFVREQIWDALSDILSWQAGDFSFESDVMPQEEDIGISFDQWETARATIPSFDDLFHTEFDRRVDRVVKPETVFCLTVDQDMDLSPISLQPAEWKTICLVDGQRSVAQILDQAVLSPRETKEVLYRLYQGGLIELPEEESADTAPAAAAPQPAQPAAPPQAAPPGQPGAEVATPAAAAPVAQPAGLQPIQADSIVAQAASEAQNAPTAAPAPPAPEPGEPPDNGSGTHAGMLEIKSLGPMGLWTREGQKEAQLFAVQKGSERTTVFLLPNGTFQFKGNLSEDEQQEVMKRINVLMNQLT